MRLRNISTIEAVNNYLDQFVKEHNDRFGKAPLSDKNIHRELSVHMILDNILCYKTLRTVSCNLTFQHNRQLDDDEEAWDIYYKGTAWLGNRSLDNGYLKPSSKIYLFLSENNVINLVWDNRNLEIFNFPAWSSQHGKFSMTKKNFFKLLKKRALGCFRILV